VTLFGITVRNAIMMLARWQRLGYRNNYPAWNTNHAINRRFGTYDLRQIDIFYDAQGGRHTTLSPSDFD
jgi:hypothetical protein